MTLSLTLTGAQVLRPEGFDTGPLSFAAGRLDDSQDHRAVDLSGYLVLPGLVDMHGDGFERHLAPRRGAMKNLGDGLQSTDAELASNGVTTAMLAQFYSWEGGMRGPEFAKRMLAALDEAKTALQTDIKVQLRFETHLLDAYEDVAALIKAHDIQYVVFNDHLPHEALEKGKRPPRLTGQALKSGRSPEAHLALLQSMHERHAEVPDRLADFAATLARHKVLLGTHDDRTQADRDWAASHNIQIAEFPETLEAAKATRAQSGTIVLGAPNVVRGGSHSGNASAADLIADGLCDTLASDYHYPALHQAAFHLADAGVCSFPQAWALVSEGPARALGLSDRGTLAAGKRADFTVINAETRKVEATCVAGEFSYLSGQAALRLLQL